MAILIITDESTHIDRESIYPFGRHLAQIADVPVALANRSNPDNRGFFQACREDISDLHVKYINPDYYTFENAPSLPHDLMDLSDVRMILLRMDYPINEEFMRYLKKRFSKTTIINDPESIITTNAKEYLEFLSTPMGDFMAPVKICRTVEEIRDFKSRFPGIVLKASQSYGGKGIYRYRDEGESDITAETDLQNLLDKAAPFLAMEYFDPPAPQSDNRLVILDGDCIGVVARTPKEGGWLCNISSGGSAMTTEPDVRELEIIARVDKVMKDEGILLYGIDTLINNQGLRVLSEINTLNVGFITETPNDKGRQRTQIAAEKIWSIYNKING